MKNHTDITLPSGNTIRVRNGARHIACAVRFKGDDHFYAISPSDIKAQFTAAIAKLDADIDFYKVEGETYAVVGMRQERACYQRKLDLLSC